MDESYFRDKLSAWFDKDLSPEEMAMMDKYVAESEEARRIVEEYRKLQELVDAKSELGGEDYWERSAKKIEQAIGLDEDTTVVEVKPKKNRWVRWQVVAAAASVAFLAFIGLHQTDIFKETDGMYAPVMTKPLPEEIAKPPGPMSPADESTAVEVDDETLSEPAAVVEDQDVADYGENISAEGFVSPKAAAPEVGVSRDGAAAEMKDVEADQSLEQMVQKEKSVKRSSAPSPPSDVSVPPPPVPEAETPAQQPVAPTRSDIHLNSVGQPTVDKKKATSALTSVKDEAAEEADAPKSVVDTGKSIVVDIAEADYVPDISKSIEVKGATASPLDTIAEADRPQVLAFYRAQRDSLEPMLPEVREAMTDYGGGHLMSLTKPDRAELAEADEMPFFDREKATEDLVTACYYIAAFSDDEVERDHVRKQLEALAADDDCPARDLAKTYLVDLQLFLKAGETDEE